jgi:hypothetical protein
MDFLIVALVFLAAPFIIAAWVRISRVDVKVRQRIHSRINGPRS